MDFLFTTTSIWGVFALFTFVFVVFAVIAHLRNKQRIEAIRNEAQKCGLTFYLSHDRKLPDRLYRIPIFSQGSDQWVTMKLVGACSGEEITLFELCCEHRRNVNGRTETQRTYYHGVILRFPKDFPFLLLRPEGFLDKLGTMIGLDDIDFESHEFSERYHVSGDDKKFAYDFFHTRMMERFLAMKINYFAVHHNDLVLYMPGPLAAEHIKPGYEAILEIRENVPAYLCDRKLTAEAQT